MAKTQEELKKLKEEYEILSNKLKGLTAEELKQVTGGVDPNANLYAIPQELNIMGHGENGKPTLPLWDQASAGLINDPKDSQS